MPPTGANNAVDSYHQELRVWLPEETLKLLELLATKKAGSIALENLEARL